MTPQRDQQNQAAAPIFASTATVVGRSEIFGWSEKNFQLLPHPTGEDWDLLVRPFNRRFSMSIHRPQHPDDLTLVGRIVGGDEDAAQEFAQTYTKKFEYM